jgi:uncharacterized DUF497 family protein
MDYAWDPAKEAVNIAKHAISFVAAIAVFADPHHLVADSTKPEYGETRSVAVGQIADGRVITVVYTMRGRVRRKLSARKARRNEQRAYVENQAAG